jgi:hypothetical protein
LTDTDGALSFDDYIEGDLGASGFDPNKSFNIEVRIYDKLTNFILEGTLPVGTPVIDMVKGGIAINGKYDGTTAGALQVAGNFSILEGTSLVDSYSAYGRSDMHRQAVMNGNFDVWQRGTTGTISDSVALGVADRWYDWHVKDGGTLPTLTRSRTSSTSIPNFGYQLISRLTTNGAGTSLGANARGYYYHKIENGTRKLAGEGRKVTVSFWARSDIANKRLGVWLVQNYGTGGSPTTQEIIQGEDFTLSGSSAWTYITKTFTLNTLSGKTFGTDYNDVLTINIQYMWGSTYGGLRGLTGTETYVGSGYIDVAKVQLNAGSVALPFCEKSFAEEYLDCQRYFQKSFPYNTTPANGAAYAGAITKVTDRSGSYQGCYTIIPIKMRATPLVTIYSPLIATPTRIVDLNTPANNYAAHVVGANERYIHIETQTSIGASVLIGVHWTADCDLA